MTTAGGRAAESGRGPGGQGSWELDEAPVPAVTAAAWQQSEAKLFPAVMTRPDIYQRAVSLVRFTLDRLRELGPSTGPLLAAGAQGGDLVAQVVEERGLSSVELDLDLIAGAALAMRHREVLAEQAAARRVRALHDAGERGLTWVVLEEAGYSPGDPFVPYHRLEAEVATGRALLVTASSDKEFRGSTHEVQSVHVDLASGQVHEARSTDVAATVHADATAREAHAAAVRDQLSAS